MKESTKAALWSFFIFPGGGHLYLGKWVSGIILAGITTAALAIVLGRIMQRANQIAEKLILGELPFDIGIIMEQVSLQTAVGDATLDMAWYILIATWLIAAIDAFRLGRVVDGKQINE